MDIGEYIKDLARSIGFLSRMPVPGRYFTDFDGSLSRAVRAFPLAGVLIALPPAAVFAVLLALRLAVMPSETASPAPGSENLAR